MTARLLPPMRLSPQLSLVPGEWLHTAISRWAHDTFGVSRRALLDAFGLSNLAASTIQALGVRLPVDIRDNIAEATGLPPQALDDATMSALHNRILWLTETLDGFAATYPRWGPWHWLKGTRFCPDCLREDPGVFATLWRSPWSFVCLRHRRILLDACSACLKPVVEMTGPNSDVFDPSTCRANVASPSEKVERCGASLTDTWEHLRAPSDSLIIYAQHRIYNPPPEEHALDQILTLQAAATGLRGGRQYDMIASLAGVEPADLVGLFDEEPHIGAAPPKSAFAMAAVTAAAFALSLRENAATTAIIRRATFSRAPGHVPRGAGYAAGSAEEILDRWGSPTTPFAGKVLRAHDEDLGLGARVKFNTTQSAATRAVTRDAIREAGRSPLPATLDRDDAVPGQLWPQWANRLDIGAPVERWALDSALARVLQRIGRTHPNASDREPQTARLLRPRMTGSKDQTTAILRGLSELVERLVLGPTPIDYSRRRTLDWGGFLTGTRWDQICEASGHRSGGDRRLLHARRFLHQRACGTHVNALPDELRIGRTRDDAPEYTMFRTTLTRELRDGLDEFAHAVLRHQGIDEPVTWSPHSETDIDWPGLDLHDIDLPRLHRLLNEGLTTMRDLSRELRRSANHISRVLDEQPRRTGSRTMTLDWSNDLPNAVVTAR